MNANGGEPGEAMGAARDIDVLAADAGLPSDPSHFLAKWRAAWPEWSIAEVFLDARSRPLADAWQALQFELTEAAWGGADARPGEAKLAWWVDELQGWSQGRRRHPLGLVLQRASTAWPDLARSIPVIATTRDRAFSADDAWAALLPVSAALARVESELFAGTASPETVTACCLHARLARHPKDAVPLDVVAPGQAQSETRWCAELLARWPQGQGNSRYRRLALALAQARLRRGSAADALPAVTTLATGWRAARR